MVLLAAIGLLVGAVLGLRYRVWALLPAICIVAGAVVLTGASHSSSLMSEAFSVVVAATSLQFGYVGGVSVRWLLAAGRAPETDSLASSSSVASNSPNRAG